VFAACHFGWALGGSSWNFLGTSKLQIATISEDRNPENGFRKDQNVMQNLRLTPPLETRMAQNELGTPFELAHALVHW
jgi:hypothetical protein